MRSSAQRLEDIRVACTAIMHYRESRDVAPGLVFDAIRIRLVEIGEAIKDLEEEMLALEPEIPWQDITRMRDLLAHRYFDTTHAIVAATARNDIPQLMAAVERLATRAQ